MENNAFDYEKVLMTKCAWYYYLENMTQQNIAELLDISRMRVIKLLERARETGLVQFQIKSENFTTMSMERRLAEKYCLNDVFIVPTPADKSHLNDSIARGAAIHIANHIKKGDFVNLGYGDTLSKVLNHLAMISDFPISFVSLTGGVNYYLPNARSNIFNARLYLMPTPLVASSKEMADAMRKEASVTEISQMLPHSTTTVVGIGSMSPFSTISKEGIVSKNDLLLLKMQGAIGDVLSHFIDKNGNLVQNPLEDRLISTPLPLLKQMSNVIGVAAGIEKVEAIRAALVGKYLNVLITDEVTASLLLDDTSERGLKEES